ncbi:hypothetical protein JTE90_029086 [Oedothorax gibbosus]|uniref:Protein kinase domain-containing protein n=1 Tax=Oedothorax gibbosus TaxID=931172 RepID=A0AAV6UWG0_9ARAC|nr:hypothetical protein JTE90_029086 [Oedothorax gibbosus]
MGHLMNISTITQPAAHISTAVPYFLCNRRTSGALYHSGRVRSRGVIIWRFFLEDSRQPKVANLQFTFFGQVFKVNSCLNEEVFALKKVIFKKSRQHQILAKREMLTLLAMRHKNVVKISEHFPSLDYSFFLPCSGVL